MAWTSMHFAIGMACTGGVGAVACTVVRKGWKWIPLAMTAGGMWAIIPDMPRLWRVDFPSLPLATTLGDKGLERWLHRWGDVFFFHHQLDLQPKEFALHGLIGMIFLYNLAILGLLWLNHRERARTARLISTNGKADRPTLRYSSHGEENSRSMSEPRSSHLSRHSPDPELIAGLVRGRSA